MSLNTFLERNFNDETIEVQIYQQRDIIRRAENQIKHLQSIALEQSQKPWYKWEDLGFYVETYDSYNRYRDTYIGKEEFYSYDEFAEAIINCVDCEWGQRSRFGDADFYIISPQKETFHVKGDFFEELPLVKEFLERKELMKKDKNDELKLSRLTSEIQTLENEIKQTGKYTPEYIQTLIENKNKKVEEKQQVEQQLQSPELIAKRIDELNQLLKGVDKILEKNK